MFWETARDAAVFGLAVLGGGLALAPPRRDYGAAEAWCVGIGWAVAALAAGAFLGHWLRIPAAGIPLGYGAILAGAWWNRGRWRELGRDGDVRELATVWVLVAAAALAMLACVFSYSGGTWMGDWEEHYHRPLVMLGLRPEDGFHPLFAFTSRPPLANAAEASLLWVTGAELARHQTMLLLLNTLAALPAALWCRTMGGGRAGLAWTGLLLTLNPLFLQNATYPWTKLITVFYVLTGLHVLLTGGTGRGRVATGFALVTLGSLAHYSAGVWLLTAGAGWLAMHRERWSGREFRTAAGWAAAAMAGVLLPWAAFAVGRYGWATTLTSNPSYAAAAQFSPLENVLSAGPKLWNSLVPHPLRGVAAGLIEQDNPWTKFRDEVFLIHQANLFWGMGSAALALLATVAWRRGWRPNPAPVRLWTTVGVATVVLGTAVHGDVDPWGMAHVCLQPLMLLGVALAASRLPRLLREGPRWPLGLAAAGALADFALGIVLHYRATALQLNRPEGQGLFDYVGGLSAVAQHNLSRKIRWRQDFFMDEVEVPWVVAMTVFTGLVALLGIRAWRLTREEAGRSAGAEPAQRAGETRTSGAE